MAKNIILSNSTNRRSASTPVSLWPITMRLRKFLHDDG